MIAVLGFVACLDVLQFKQQGANFTYEVIVVNDGSSDGTSAVAFDFIRRFGFDAVRLLQLPQNCGKVPWVPPCQIHYSVISSIHRTMHPLSAAPGVMQSCQNRGRTAAQELLRSLRRRQRLFLTMMQGYAVKAGMLCARGELLLMADADGATVAAEEQRLEEALQKVKVRPAPATVHFVCWAEI